MTIVGPNRLFVELESEELRPPEEFNHHHTAIISLHHAPTGASVPVFSGLNLKNTQTRVGWTL